MKIAYLASASISDSEFPLIRELQRRDLDIIFYFPIEGEKFNKGLLNIGDVKNFDGIINASEYEAFREYNGYLKLDNIYVINNYHWYRRNWQSWMVWIKFMCHLKEQHVTMLHFCWPFTWQRKMLYLLDIPMVMTVHDPIPHSSQEGSREEKIRKKAFKKSKKYLLLNNIQQEEFCKRYNVSNKDVYITRFGRFDWIDRISTSRINEHNKYIFFWGQIQSHKGIDILLESMIIVHQLIPELKLIVAGKGDFYFDIEKYRNLDYIEIRNYYLTVEEMVGLLKGCLFAVAPYKDATQSGVVQTSFSAGKPIVVTNVGNMGITVSHETTGLVIPPNDVRALSDAIVKLANDRCLLTKCQENIKNVWMQDMSWEPIGAEYERLYSSVID